LRPFPVRLPSGTRYWTVIDDDLRPVPVADASAVLVFVFIPVVLGKLVAEPAAEDEHGP
jgi:hypothetical protein